MSAIEMHPSAPRDGGAVWALGDDCHGQLGDGPPSTSENVDAACGATLRLAQSAGLDDVVTVRVRDSSVFAVAGDGTLWAWGDNSDGQLGDGTTTDQDEPVRVPGLPQVVDVTVGDDVYVVAADGTVWRWQFDPHGRYRASRPSPTTPEQITGISGVTSVAEDYEGRLWTLRSDGTVVGWNDVCGYKSRPTTVADLDDVVQVGAWSWGGVALRADGTVWAWSYDCYQSDVDDAAQIPGLTDIAWLDDDLVLKKDGTVWALSTDHQLEAWKLSPVPGLTDIVAAVHVDDSYSTEAYALRRDGSVWSWSERSSPRLVPGLPTATQIAGSETAVFVVAGGDPPGPSATPVHAATPGPVVAWPERDPASTRTTDIDQAVALAGRYGNGYAVLDDGTVLAWGDNRRGQLGNGTADEDPHPDPVAIEGLSDIVSVFPDTTSAYAVDASGKVWAWGGSSLKPSRPEQVPGLDDVTKAVGYITMYALRRDGTVWSWGCCSSPAPVPGLTDVVDISPSIDSLAAVKADGTVWVLDDKYPDPPELGQVSGLDGATSLLGTGDGWWFVAMADGTVRVVRTPWATSRDRPVPIADLLVAEMEGLTDVVKVVGDLSDYVALRADGSLWAFGTPGATFIAPDQTIVSSTRGISGLGVGPVEGLPPLTDLMVSGSSVYAITNA